MADALPFIVAPTKKQDECHRCRKSIEKGVPLKIKGKFSKSGRLKMGAMSQSETEDTKVPLWFHVECFFKSKNCVDESKIRNFSTLSNTDKALIRQHNVDPVQPTFVAKKRPREADVEVRESTKTILKEYRIELCDTVDRICQSCFVAIADGKISIMKTVAGTINLWYHAKCFERHKLNLGWNEAVGKFPGFGKLCKDTKEKMKMLFTTEADDNNNEPDTKRLKLGDINDVNEIIDAKIKSQNKNFSSLRNELKSHLKHSDYVAILKENEQFIPDEPNKLLDHVTDVIYFGPMSNCKECKTGKLIFDGNESYLCNETISGYANCTNKVKIPQRRTVKIPKNIKASCVNKKFKTKGRAIKLPTDFIKSIRTRLRGLEFFVDGNLKKSKRDITLAIENMDGRVGNFVHKRTAAIISDAEGIEEMGPFMVNACNLGIQVVPVSFLDHVKIADPFSLIKDMNLSLWQCIDPSQRIPRNGILVSKPDEHIDPKPKTQKWKNGAAIDADCKLEGVHVYSPCRGCYNFVAIMSLVDISKNKNSYHRMQLLESDDNKRYWIFQKSGRIGTTIGKTEEQEYSSVEHAEREFRKIFMDLTGNDFDPNVPFVKQPDKYQLLKMKCDAQKDVLKSLVPPKLEARKYGLMELICDEKAMKDTMLSFDLDTNMPLGKLSKTQIDIAMGILTELSTMAKRKASRNEFVEASNRFYTTIPHTFDADGPRVINTSDQIAKKLEMLEHLANIKLTYRLLNGTDNETNPLDHLYQNLNANIKALDRTSVDFRDIERYVNLTKWDWNNVEIVNAFEVSRAGETQRFEAFKQLHNRQLLWHGSSITNFVGLLSQGLKIAPPDVQSNGSNFGRGLYFADAIAKSLSYCSYSREHVGLLLLCEVALGDSMDVTRPQPIAQLPNGIHSTKCIGARTLSGLKKRPDGLLIPDGKKMRDKTKQMPFNELIVYNEAQVRVKYVVMVKLAHPESSE